MLGKPDTTNEPHVCDAERCPDGGKYYVSAIDHDAWWAVAGPYNTHAAALADVNKARDISVEHKSKSWFFSWGTVRMPDDYAEPGMLNKHQLI